MKTLIIMHRDSLRKQWLNSLYNMCGLSDDEVHEIADSQELYDIAHDNHEFDYDVYLMTHATFRAGLKRIGNLKDAGNITKNLGIGLKIIDEAHLEFRDTLMMDFVFNVGRNLYLTATDGRSSKSENAIFRHVFANTTFYKPSMLLTSNQPSKWVEYNIVALNTHVKPNIYRYKVNGGRGMNTVSYGKWVIQYDKQQRHFKCCRDILKMIYEKNETAKVLLFMPLIDLCTECAYFLTKGLNYDESFPYDLTIRTINSKNSKSENNDNKHADVIVTTVSSCGTGTDIPGITDIICCSPFVSKIVAKQVFGRIRYCGKECHYYDIYDTSVKMDEYWLRSRKKYFSNAATKTNFIEWIEDIEKPS
jgi:superfamily II DNA or RNA helicase